MITVYVELSGEAPDLARAEATAAAEALGGRGPPRDPATPPGVVAVELPGEELGARLASRLGLARRCLVLRAEGEAIRAFLDSAGRSGRSAAIRRLGRPSSGGDDPSVRAAGRAYRDGGGRIDLDAPERRFWLSDGARGGDRCFEEVAAVDRTAVSARRMPRLPFQRPVSLAPRLARAAANLARIRPGDRVVDPFLGTGALLAEAGLLGARLFGSDRDAEMVRGAIRNLAHLGLAAEALAVGDSGSVDLGPEGVPFDAVLTDPPYGRASSTGGEGGRGVVSRVLPRWASRVRPGGRIVLIVAEPVDPPGDDWRLARAVPVRVHRSLTREFRVYERLTATANPA
jgi:tRNA (guanine10-N2)-dimethyltransferase